MFSAIQAAATGVAASACSRVSHRLIAVADEAGLLAELRQHPGLRRLCDLLERAARDLVCRDANVAHTGSLLELR
jgi:hypothetical protein